MWTKHLSYEDKTVNRYTLVTVYAILSHSFLNVRDVCDGSVCKLWFLIHSLC